MTAEPMATSAYWPALKRSRPTSRRRSRRLPARRDVVARANVSLAFLQPPSDTAYLGRLAQFDVMRVLGRGGMGVVLEAFDSRLQRNVAIKVLDPDLAGDEVARQRFCREARAAASITHENVVAVHQVEKAGEDGLPYLVMQLIAGESLEQRLAREKQLPLREIVRIGMQAVAWPGRGARAGLDSSRHQAGQYPARAPQDRVKLTDFGLARVAEDVKLTRTGFVSGTPLYMAPEQALGERSRPSGRPVQPGRHSVRNVRRAAAVCRQFGAGDSQANRRRQASPAARSRTRRFPAGCPRRSTACSPKSRPTAFKPRPSWRSCSNSTGR